MGGGCQERYGKEKQHFVLLLPPPLTQSFKRQTIWKGQNLAEVMTKARNEGTQEINKPNLKRKGK